MGDKILENTCIYAQKDERLFPLAAIQKVFEI